MWLLYYERGVLPASPAASCLLRHLQQMHVRNCVAMPGQLHPASSVPPANLCLPLDAQAMVQMDSATKWGQEKSNSLVFNTFIFMQATLCSRMCMRS